MKGAYTVDAEIDALARPRTDGTRVDVGIRHDDHVAGLRFDVHAGAGQVQRVRGAVAPHGLHEILVELCQLRVRLPISLHQRPPRQRLIFLKIQLPI